MGCWTESIKKTKIENLKNWNVVVGFGQKVMRECDKQQNVIGFEVGEVQDTCGTWRSSGRI